MSERPYHNNPWADKLDQVSLPEAGEAKHRLLLLLDREMPLPPRKSYRRWVLLAILLLLLVGVCNCPGLSPFGRPAMLPPRVHPVANPGRDDKASVATVIHNHRSQQTTKDSADPIRDHGPQADKFISGDSHPEPVEGRPRRAPGTRYNVRLQPAFTGAGGKEQKRLTSTPIPTDASAEAPAKADKEPPAGHRGTSSGARTVATGEWPMKPSLVASDITRAYVLNGPAAVIPVTDTTILKKSSPADSTSKKKPTKQPNRRGWAVAIGLNHSLPVSGQQKITTGPDGNGGAIGDYIPVPQLRYDFNSKWYVQLELAVRAPQYTRPLVLQQRKDTIQGGNLVHAVTLQKLFYLRAPIGVFYSPIKNGYVGLGLRPGRLTNAAGLFEYRVTGRYDSVLSSKKQSLKTADSTTVYESFSSFDWQLFTGISYEWKKLSAGLRYYSSIGPYINIPVSGGAPAKASNHSLELFIRFTLWRQKTAAASAFTSAIK